MSDFHLEEADDEVLFYAYEVYRGEDRYKMRLVERVGSNLEGVAKANAPRDVSDKVLGTFQEVVDREARSPRRSFRLVRGT
jgi:hypothetical protein